jgi:hypothetical protein
MTVRDEMIPAAASAIISFIESLPEFEPDQGSPGNQQTPAG